MSQKLGKVSRKANETIRARHQHVVRTGLATAPATRETQEQRSDAIFAERKKERRFSDDWNLSVTRARGVH
jgi:hypothetical protein